jgi:hypothetical protein
MTSDYFLDILKSWRRCDDATRLDVYSGVDYRRLVLVVSISHKPKARAGKTPVKHLWWQCPTNVGSRENLATTKCLGVVPIGLPK